jgi:hypothetical protein
MNGWKAIIVCLLLPLIGCAAPTPAPRTNPNPRPNLVHRSADPTVNRSLQAMGGLDRLTTHAYLVSATVTQYSPSDPPTIWQVQMRIDPAMRTLGAHAPTGSGQWRAAVQGSLCSLDAQGDHQPTALQRKAICEMVQTVLHRVSGPLNFDVADEQSRGTTGAVVDGEHVLRVGVAGGDAGIRAYYFDPSTGLLRFASAGSDAPGKPGTVTIYTWQKVRGGVMFPQTLRVVDIGQHTLVGLKDVLEVDFDRVQLVEVPRERAD